jgi:hypothetical protein
MYNTCPKCGHIRHPDDHAPAGQCPACGLIFEKWLKQRFRPTEPHPKPSAAAQVAAATAGWRERLLPLLLEPGTPANPLVFYAHAALFLVLLVWGWNFILMDYYRVVDGQRFDLAYPAIYQSFLHNVNLAFHEAGHVLFQPFGRFMAILGGSLMQVLMPLIVTLVFLLKERNPFAASVGLWWVGQNLLDVAPYINDARAGQIPLIGGGSGRDRPGFHDWTNLLGDLGLLHRDHGIAALVDGLGVLVMLLAMAWGGLLLWREYQAQGH